MEFTNEFRVPADIDTVLLTLTDLEKVAPCMPGATLEEVDGDTYAGRMKVKLGRIQITYRGTAEVTEADQEAKRASISASGKETRGSGTAKADVTAKLAEDSGETVVTVHTDINVTGKPAQLGRGVMADVGTRIVNQFADRLKRMLEEGGSAEADATGTAGDEPLEAEESASSEATSPRVTTSGAATTGPRRLPEDPSRLDDALDLMEVAGSATIKRLVPLVAAVAALVGVIWWLRQR